MCILKKKLKLQSSLNLKSIDSRGADGQRAEEQMDREQRADGQI